MSFIEATPFQAATGEAEAMFARQQAHYGYVPNYAKVFGDRPDILNLWADLLAGIRRHVEPRRFELVTFAAALELGSSYCALAHGKVLQDRFLTREQMGALAEGDVGSLPEAEMAMMDLARKVVSDSSSVTREDVERLRDHGLRDDEIFDVVAVAAARSFFARLVDALGALPDASYRELDEDLRERLTVGRPIASQPPERMALRARRAGAGSGSPGSRGRGRAKGWTGPVPRGSRGAGRAAATRGSSPGADRGT